MVQLQQPFNADAIAPSSRPEPIDEGWYPAIMVASELKPTSAGDGGFFELIFDIIDGVYKGRKQYARLNVYNQNEQTVQIALGQLSAICWSTGVHNIQDTQQLHNIPLQIYVVKKRNERDGGMTNDIRGYRDINGNEPWKTGGGQPQGQPQQQGWGSGQPQQPAQPAATAGGWQGPPSGGSAPAGWQPPAGGAPAQPQGQPQPQGSNGPWQGQPQPQPQQQPQPTNPQPQAGWQGGTPPNQPPWGNK